ncbi:hypothetical protein [Pseudomonas sp. Irchel s3h17]|uniref:hypothetical protein n=1 Tax=Pseudomonas sp. Irchel s3h17 TaxID=2009182 RepID=UPI000BA3CB9A|nr:hypothetical protein [Pseudomonas sp. Irchel s3h17]
MTQGRYLLGGWSQQLSHEPLPEFTDMMYGMVTNLSGLTTGTQSNPGWSPAGSQAPRFEQYSGSTRWTYGGGFCSPRAMPGNQADVQAILDATAAGGWDGVDFDDECNMNIDLVIDAMGQLKQQGKQTSYGFIAGYSYCAPTTTSGSALNAKVLKVIESGQCDHLVHYCYGSKMWTDDEIARYVGQALERSISHGAQPAKVILALTAIGLTDNNLNTFLDQITRLEIGGLYIWAYQRLSDVHKQTIIGRLCRASGVTREYPRC